VVGIRLVAAVAAAGALTACTLTAQATGPMAGGARMHGARATSCTLPSGLPGTVVEVHLADMAGGMMWGGGRMMLRVVPSVVRPGTVTLVAYNMGTRPHELVVLPLAGGQVVGRRVVGTDGKVDESAALGEASTSCGSGPGEGIAAGSASWVTLTLAPGRYELVCNLKNHYPSGMYAELDVTG
jgi:sulfocyanin SoxE-like protein